MSTRRRSSPLDPPKGTARSSPLDPPDPPEGTAREVDMQTDCQRIAPVLHRYVEGELDPIRGQMVESHLAECPACLSEKEQLDLERLWLVETALEGPILSTRLVDKVMEPVRREAAARSSSRRWRRTIMASAAACLFALIVGWSSGWSWTSETGAPILTAQVEPSPAGPLEADSLEVGTLAVRVSDRDGHLNPEEIQLLAVSPRISPRMSPGTPIRTSPRGFGNLPLAQVQPVEHGGFWNDQTNPTFVNFGLPNVSCLPQAASHEGPSCEAIPREPIRDPRRVARPTRIIHVKLAVGTTFRFKFRDSFGIALRLTNNRERSREGHTVRPPAALIDLDPCIPDPNSDGKTDSGDVAYGLQVLYGAQPPDVYDVEPTALDPECEGSCLRA